MMFKIRARVGIAAICLVLAVPLEAYAQDILGDLSKMQDAAFDVPFDAPDFEARNAFLAVRTRAEAALATETDPQTLAELRRFLGVSSFYAAQSFHPANEEEILLEISLLDDTRRLLAPILASDPADGQSYEYRGASGQLFDYGKKRNDPRWVEWSADRVQANRYRVKQFADDPFEKTLLAEALFDHGWLAKDSSALAEAEQITGAIPEDELRSTTRRKLEQVKAGNAPY